MKKIFWTMIVAAVATSFAYTQVPLTTLVQITKAEDARRYDSVLEGLLKSPNAEIRKRAAVATGRIGDKRAVPVLAALFEDTKNAGGVWTAAAFALGEIESAGGGEAILNILKAESGYAKRDKDVLSRAVEAAGKIVAANAKDAKLAELKSAIVRVLNDEIASGSRIREVVLSGLTAVLRTRPEGGDAIVAKFLSDPDARIRTDAANTLTRLRAKNANETLRKMLSGEPDGAARANAARALGAAEDKNALDLLIKAATSDPDLRVRVSAMRAVGSLKDASAADRLIERGNQLLIPIHGDPGPIRPGQKVKDLKPIEVPLPKNELLEIASVLGRLLPGTSDQNAVILLNKLRMADSFSSPETEIALAQVAPKEYVAMQFPAGFAYKDWHMAAAYAQGMAEIGKSKDKDLIAQAGEKLAAYIAGMATGVNVRDQAKFMLAMPELTSAMAALKPDNLDEIFRKQLLNDDVYIRAAAAGAMADQPVSDENFEALKKAFINSIITDKASDDAQLAILNAMFKLDKKRSISTALLAVNNHNYIVRKKALEMLRDEDLQKEYPGVPMSLENALSKHKDQVLPYDPSVHSKLGVVLNTDADYRRALSRKNGSISAVLTTEKGAFTIVFNPEEAPLTVDNWVKLARSGYFNGLEVHRVVPNFVMQDGDPRGDGNGGPGWSIRCEVNTLPYDRGAVGMALSGKDTGGSQWFVTHSPQPHLDGGYTVFGHVDETGMKVVDNIVRGDKILKVVIIGK